MTDLYDHIIELLGKPEDDPLYSKLVRDLGEPSIIEETPELRMFSFPNQGFVLASAVLPDMSGARLFRNATFVFDTSRTPGGEWVPFAGKLPGGISCGDGPEDVHEKFIKAGAKQPTPDHSWGYWLGPQLWVFGFDDKTQFLNMALVSFFGDVELSLMTTKHDDLPGG
jgi:hypothetical protein